MHRHAVDHRGPDLARDVGTEVRHAGTTEDDRPGAVAAHTLVPSGTSAFADARIAAAELCCAIVGGRGPTVSDLRTASEIVATTNLQPAARLELQRAVQDRALGLLVDGAAAPDPSVFVGSTSFSETELRLALEATYRSLAHLAPDDAERNALVDTANAVRPRSLT